MSYSTNYDIIIIGAGISGLTSAYTIIEKNPDTKILIIDKGNPIEKRCCPASKTQKCLKCSPCNIMTGVAGCGCFSDAKFILSGNYGGWLADEIGCEETNKYISKINDILVIFGDNSKIYEPSDRLKLLCVQHDITMIQSPLKHLGTDNNFKTMVRFINYLKEKNIEFLTNTEVFKIYNKCVKTNNGDFIGEKIIIAVGRGGGNLVSNYCEENRIEVKNNQIDIGIRYELPSIIWENFSNDIYEPKILFKTKQYGDTVRTFCYNHKGFVVNENTNGIITCNGHAYKNTKSENSNFAILSSINFTNPFNNPVEYVQYISKLANMIGDGTTIVQRFGDLINGKRSTYDRISKSSVKPTLKCTEGDISLVLPKRILDNIIEMIYKLDEVAPGTANYDNLLYAVEAKYYSVRPKHDGNFMISDGVYCIGDGSGVSRSLSQSGAMGIMVGETIINA